MQQNERRPAAEATAGRGAEGGFQPGNRPLNTNTEPVGEVENGRPTAKSSAPTSRVAEICSRSMARRMLGNAVRLVPLKPDIPAFLKARSGEAVLALAKIDPGQAVAHVKDLAARCEAACAAAGVANGNTEANHGDAG